MKKINILSIIIIFLQVNCYTQDLFKVDEVVSEYSQKFSKPEKLANQINKDFQTEIEKARAIYTWIALNVRYDVEQYYSKKKKGQSFTYSTTEERIKKEKEIELNLAKNTLKKNKAVCAGYSTLFKRLCELTNLECEIVNGSSKTKKGDIGKSPKRSDHAWNVVKIEGEWYLVDATWGAGYTISKEFIADYNDIWFMTKLGDFFLNHYPKNEEWLLVKKTRKEFENLPLFYSSYLTSDIEIIHPKSGEITKAPNEHVKFKIKTTEDQSNFRYDFQNNKYSERIEFEKKGDYYTFSIPIENRKTGFITIYFKNKSIVKYKVKIK